MMKSLITFAAALCIVSPAFAGGAKCTTVKNLPIATDSKDFEQVTVRRTAIPGKENLEGLIAVEVFGLTADDAGTFDDGNIEFVEACETPLGPTLRYKVMAFSDQGRWHTADIPIPTGVKNLKVRWCSKSEGCPMQGTYTGGGEVELQAGRKTAKRDL